MPMILSLGTARVYAGQIKAEELKPRNTPTTQTILLIFSCILFSLWFAFGSWTPWTRLTLLTVA